MTEPLRLVARSHAVFSEDSTSLVTDGKRALRLRKWLCKAWWNDDFRDRLLGLMAVLSDNQSAFHLPLGGAAVAAVDASPLAFTAPLTYVQHDPEQPAETDDTTDPDDEIIRPGDAAEIDPGDDDDLDDDEDSDEEAGAT
ncbi:MAG: hypothetical protein ACLQBA_13990 [Candidatus Binataceae bacterium]